MGDSLKAILGLCLIIGLGGAVVAWAMLDEKPAAYILWSMRIAFPAVAILAGRTLLRDAIRKELIPDYISRIAHGFTRDGLCICVVPAVNAGHLEFTIVYQNCFADRCSATVLVLPPPRSFSMSRREEMKARLDIDCDGGAVGLGRMRVGVPQSYQGKNLLFELFADVSYPDGRGERLRKPRGTQMGRAGTGVAGASFGGLQVLGALCSVSVLTKPAQHLVRVPTGISETAAALPEANTIIWRPGDQPLVIELVGSTAETT